MTTFTLWAIWIATLGGIPIPVSYHGTEQGCKNTLEYVRKLAPGKSMECIPGDYAPPPTSAKRQAPV